MHSTMPNFVFLGVSAMLAVANVASAQQTPAIRPLGPVIATAKELLGAQVFVRHLKGGVIVNDVGGRRLIMFDTALNNPTVIADSTSATANAYSGRTGGLIAYRGDSSLFVDPQSLSMLVIDGAGKVARVMSVPRSQDAMTLGSGALGAAGFDGQGRLVYRAMPRFQMRRGPGDAPTPPEVADSSPIVRVDLATRAVDTIGYTKVPRPKMDIQRDTMGRMSVSMQVNPLPVVDDFAVLSDGSVALVRGRDYHVDWVRSDGTRESSGKVPHEWQRLTDEDKVAFIDSLKAARERFLAANPPPSAPTANSNTVTTPGGQQRTEMIVMGGGPGGGGPGGPPGANMAMGRNVSFIPANELPDYKPPFFAGAVRADADGNLWIQTIPTKGIAGGTVYDVLNGKGELVERVQIPKDRTIVGFGSGVVYLAARDGGKTTLEKARIR